MEEIMRGGKSSQMSNPSNEDLRRRLGNVDQIRDLLFGSKLAEYEQRFQEYDQQLNQMDANLTELKAETRDRLNLLRSDLLNEMQIGLEKLNRQVDQLQLSNTEQGHKSLSIEQRYVQDIESVKQSLTDQTQFLKTDLIQTRRQMQEDLVSLSEKLTQALYAEVANVHETKLSQVDLADILFELCLKLKNSRAESSTIDPAAASIESPEGNANALQNKQYLL
jgi:small-conductance mechanosensitive channel